MKDMKDMNDMNDMNDTVRKLKTVVRRIRKMQTAILDMFDDQKLSKGLVALRLGEFADSLETIMITAGYKGTTVSKGKDTTAKRKGKENK